MNERMAKVWRMDGGVGADGYVCRMMAGVFTYQCGGLVLVLRKDGS